MLYKQLEDYMSLKEEAVEVLCKKANKLFGVDSSTLNENTTFEELNCKSQNMVQFSAALEDEFEIEVPYMEIAKKKTFGEIAEWIESQL